MSPFLNFCSRKGALLVLLAASSPLAETPAPLEALADSVHYRNFFGDMSFDRPLLFAQYPGEDSAYVVLEQVGRITSVEWQDSAWTKTGAAEIAVPVVSNTQGGKCSNPDERQTSPGITGGLYESRGLLSFAFHPDYAENGKYYISYVTVQDSSGATHERSIVAERVADSTTLRPATDDPERALINICQPGWDHKGGHIEFGHDGHLYFTTGDGGNQNLGSSLDNPSLQRNTWLGKVLRIDVDSPPDEGKEYAVPADNPFVDSSAYLPEVWAWGLRNPWKWHFHPETGEMWLGNVGWTANDAIYRIPAGANMGWPIWEGNHCSSHNDLGALCESADFHLPALTMQHGQQVRSLTGGTFFVGDTAAALHDVYFFGDYIYGRVWMARFNGNDSLMDMTQINDIGRVASFDRDSLGRMFAVSLDGTVFTIESPWFGKPYEAPPVNLQGIPERRANAIVDPISSADYLREPDRFSVRGLDGRAIRGQAAGTVWIREKGSRRPPQLITILP